MAEFYRFRSINALLGKFQELEKQTIYFASPDELNDPMEGIRDIVWNGDQIVWTNFFKHYIFCLHRIYWLFKTARKPTKLEVDSIPILERWDQLTTPLEKILFNDIWDKFYSLPNIQGVIEELSNTTHKTKYREIIYYLECIQHFGLLDEIHKSYISHGLISESEISQQPVILDGTVESLLNLIRTVGATENEQLLDSIFQLAEAEHDDIYLKQQHKIRATSTRIPRNNDLLMMYDFPRLYVEQLDRLLWSKWYTACFTGSFHNSSVWAKYADGHKGACLIFEDVENDNSTSLKLNYKTSNSSRTIPFREVHYADRPGEIDFFRTICRTTVSTLKELWYTDQNGNISECAAHIGSDSDEAAWKELYWNNFFRDVTFKTKDLGV